MVEAVYREPGACRRSRRVVDVKQVGKEIGPSECNQEKISRQSATICPFDVRITVATNVPY